MSLQNRLKIRRPEEGLEILNNINDAVLVFNNKTVVFANSSAAELFGFSAPARMKNLKLTDITSEYEKKTEYKSTRSSEYLIYHDEDDSKRFRWIHKRRGGENFYSEVIAIQLPEQISKHWLHSQCVIVSDLSKWNDLKSKAEKNFLTTRNLINNIQQVILIIDPETGNILDANTRATAFYAYNLEELLKLNIDDINILPMEAIKAEMQKAKEEKRGHFLFKHRTAIGEILDVKVMSGPVNYNGKTVLYSIVAPSGEKLVPVKMNDFERMASTDQNLFESLFHHMHIPAVMFNTDMRVRAANSAFLNEFEYSIKEVMNHHITPLICPWEYIEEAELFHNLVLKGKNIYEDVVRKSKSGRIKYYKVNGFPLFFKGKIAGIVAIYLDVDEERKTSTKLHLINKIFENIDEGMLITDSNKKITWVNQGFEKITGFGFDYVLGESPGILQSGRHDPMFYQMMWHELETSGYWEGEVFNKKNGGEEYQAWLSIASVKDKRDRVTNYVGVMNDITKYKAQEEKIRRLAKTDVLTGLINRSTFMEMAIFKLKRTPENVKHALLFMDLDDFKKINDMYGHDQGDKLLKIIAYRLKASFKSKDTVARIGGDEFIIMLEDIEVDQIPEIIERLFEGIGKTIELDNNNVNMKASIGVSIYPDDAKSLVNLMKTADIALYHAKESIGSSYSYYSIEIENKFRRNNQLEENLKQALEKDEFDIYYQGIVDCNLERVTAAEALARWSNPELGDVEPSVFIPVAEKIGIMPELGLWIIERVFSDMKKWNCYGSLEEGVSINISIAQLVDSSFPEKVEALIDKYGVNVKQVEFEITESVCIDNFDLVVQVLNRLNQIGIRITMDDFGTGYSSLSMIHKLGLSKIKIDRSFICDLPHEDTSVTLTNTVINLAKSLDFKVVAEGVEIEEQVNFLKGKSCDFIQGYYYSKPVCAENFFSLIQEDI